MTTTYKISEDNETVELYYGDRKIGEVPVSLLQHADAEEASYWAEKAMLRYFGWEWYESKASCLPTPAEAGAALLVARDELLETGILRTATREDDREAARRFWAEMGFSEE